MLPENVLKKICNIRVPRDTMRNIFYSVEPSDSERFSHWNLAPPSLSIHEFLKYKLLTLGKRLGYFPYPEFHMVLPGGKVGQIDVAWVDQNEIKRIWVEQSKDEFDDILCEVKHPNPARLLPFVFEIETKYPSAGENYQKTGRRLHWQKTLTKLRGLKKLVKHRILVVYSPRYSSWGLSKDIPEDSLDLLRKFTKNGISVFVNTPLPWRLLCGRCEVFSEELDKLLKAGKLSKRKHALFTKKLESLWARASKMRERGTRGLHLLSDFELKEAKQIYEGISYFFGIEDKIENQK